MLNWAEEMKRFEESCTSCGYCVTICPIIPMTDIRNEDPGDVIESVLDIFRHGTIDSRAKTRIYSCMGCLTCHPHCPEGLDPSVGLFLAATILQEKGEPLPRALSFLLPGAEINLMKAVEALQVTPEERPWITDVKSQKPAPSKTVIFTGCTGIMQPDLVLTTLDIISRIDPTVKALGGVDYCCGDTLLRAGKPQLANDHFYQLIEGLNGFSPEDVVCLCPTCKLYFDQYRPKTDWSWHFITNFLVDHLDELGPFSEIKGTVTIHDACHVVRSERPDFESPRRLLKKIPGIEIIEMKNSREKALCCGSTAMAAIGRPGVEFRARRLKEVEETGAEIMTLYCPACQSIFASEGPNMPFKIESIIKLLGKAMGIVHEDSLFCYFSYHDHQRVLSEAARYINASELPNETLAGFCSKYFR